MVNKHSDLDPKSIPPCIIVIFGATGDLTARKLIPALYELMHEHMLPENFACVGFARREKDHNIFREEMKKAIEEHARVKPVDQKVWAHFSERLFYHKSNFDDDKGYQDLKTFLDDLDKKLGTQGNRVFYLSTQPSFFTTITEKLKGAGHIYPYQENATPWSRIIIEKPFGRDLESAQKLQQDLTQHLAEPQIFRIDHYLGKETVQNLLVMRFANSIFESVWNYKHIDRIQITVSEDIGIGTRGKFFEEAGLLRDIVQNHMMQLLTLVAMEPPTSLTANSIRDEKVKVLHSMRPIPEDKMDTRALRGQYGPGVLKGQKVKGYREEDNVDPASNIETYVALKLFIENWRWANVPFYLRAGKRLPTKMTEIAIFFKQAPGVLFQEIDQNRTPNMLGIRIQPDEGIAFSINSKIPGFQTKFQPVKMDFKYSTYFGLAPPEAYERLILDCILNDSTLFAREDEVMASWKIITPILKHWEETKPEKFPNYPAGTWGPETAQQMLQSCKHISIIE